LRKRTFVGKSLSPIDYFCYIKVVHRQENFTQDFFFKLTSRKLRLNLNEGEQNFSKFQGGVLLGHYVIS